MENLNYSFSEWHRYVSRYVHNFIMLMLKLFCAVNILQLYFLSSGLSLYFPYDFCLFDEIDAIVSYGLRYIPAITTSVVVIALFAVYKLVYSHSNYYCTHTNIRT